MFPLHTSPFRGWWRLLVCCLLPLWGWSQQPTRDPITRAQKYVDKAEDYYARAQFEASIKEYQFASQIYREHQRTDLYGICYNGVGNNYVDLTRYAEAHKEFSRVLYQYAEMVAADTSFTPDSTIVADALEGLGRFFMNAQENLINKNLREQKGINFDTALHYHRRAMELRVKYLGERHAKTALSHYFMALCYGNMQLDTLRLGDPTYTNPLEQKLVFLEKALAIQQQTVGEQHYQTADTYSALGDFYYEVRHDYEKGMGYHQKALHIRRTIFGDVHPKIAHSYIGIANYYRILNVFDTELEYLEKALQIRLQILGQEHKDIAVNYVLLANRYRASGDLDKALTYYTQAQNIFTTLLGAWSIEVGDVYLALALCYRDMNESRQERLALEKALQIRKKTFGNQHFKVGEIYFEIGNFYLEHPTTYPVAQLKDSIIQYYKLAGQLWERQLGKEHFLLAKMNDNYAKVFYMLGDEAQEMVYLKKSLESRQLADKADSDTEFNRFEMSDGDMSDVSAGGGETSKKQTQHELFDSYLNLARFYRRKKDYKIALIYAQNALESVAGSLAKHSGNLYRNPSVNELTQNLRWMEALQEKADLFQLQYLEGDKQVKDIEFSLETYRLAINVMDTLRMKFSSDASRQQLTVRSIRLYEGAITTYYALYGLTPKEEYLEQAFQIAERSKAFVLLQALHHQRAKGFGDVPAELLIEEEHLRQSLAYYGNPQKNKGVDAAAFQKTYFAKKRSYDSLMTVIESQYPKYHQLKHNTTVANSQQIQTTMLDDATILLEYFLGDQYLYGFRFSKTDKQFFQIALPKNYTNWVMNLRRCLTDYDAISADPLAAYKHFVEASYTFYKTFVEGFMKGISPDKIQKIILVPDGILSYVPFEALLQSQPDDIEQVNYKNLRYLLVDYQINYTYSSTLLLENMKQGRLKNNGRCLGFAPTYNQATTAGAKDELPWAEKEVKAIQQVYSGDYLYADMASKEQFISKAPDYSIIHLAMHGLADTKHPMNSKLAFTPAGGHKEDERSFLHAYEINNLKLHADLVVLSACETGFGKALRGEGVVSLAWMFMYAGAPSVITTLWQVNDFTSSTIMTHFYQNLQNGYDKPEALRRAKLNFLETSDQISGHPIFWASFISIGDPEPVSQGWAWWVWVLFVAGLLGSGYAGYWWWNKRNQHKRNALQMPDHSDADALISLLQQPQQEKDIETSEITDPQAPPTEQPENNSPETPPQNKI